MKEEYGAHNLHWLAILLDFLPYETILHVDHQAVEDEL
jgi:hypothetical protein